MKPPAPETNVEQSPMACGALIAPDGTAGDALDQDEYDTLKACLRMSQFGTHEMEAITRAIYSCRKPEKQTLPFFMRQLLKHLGTHSEEIKGILADTYDPPHYLNDEKEFERLRDFLKVLRMDGWFAEWIALQVETVPAGNPQPTPLQAMQSMVDDLEQFNLELIIAQRMHEQHPELVAPGKAARGNAA